MARRAFASRPDRLRAGDAGGRPLQEKSRILASMKICVLGLGYVGAVSAGCLAKDGHEVIGVDPERTKVDLINAGKSPIIEKDIGDIIHEQVAAGRLRASTEVGRRGAPYRPRAGVRRHAEPAERRHRPHLHQARVPADRRDHRHAPGRAGDRHAQHHAARHDARGGDPDPGESIPARKPARNSACASTPNSCAKAPRCTTTTIRRRR